jgi:3'(2'), 5'-bisphosphate nucleotidase
MELQPKFSPDTDLAIKAALEASRAVMEVYAKDFSVQSKADKEPVTEADIASDKVIQSIVSSAGYPILSEEVTDDKSRLEHDKVWIIDPLDGTRDFIDKTGEFSIMIALIENHKPIIGVVYQPTIDLLYVAEFGQGIYQKQNNVWQKLAVSDLTDLSKVQAITSRSHLTDDEREFLQKLGVVDFKQKGSCGLKVGDICQSTAQLYFTTTDKIKHWDTAAAYCMIKEAGGLMTDMLGNDMSYNIDITNHQHGILVTNGHLHQQIVGQYKTFI